MRPSILQPFPDRLSWGFVVFCLLLTATAFAQPQPPDTLWTYQYRGPQDDTGMDMAATSDGGLVFAIESEAQGGDSSRTVLVHLDANGHVVWQRRYWEFPLSGMRSIAETPDHGFVFAGTHNRSDDTGVLRVDSMGSPLWYRHYRPLSLSMAVDIVATPDGRLAVLLYGGSGALAHPALWRLNANGDSLWTRQYGSTVSAWAHEVVVTPDGGFLIGALRAYYHPVVAMQPWIMKTDSAGQVQWERLLGTDGDEWCNSLALTEDGGCIIAGSYDPDGTLTHIYPFAARLSGSGDSLWANVWWDREGAAVCRCRRLPDGGFGLVGNALNAYPDRDSSRYFMMEIDTVGDLLWDRCYDGGSSSAGAMALCVLADSSLAIGGGQWNGPATRDDAWAARLQWPASAVPSFIPHPSSFILSCFPNPFNPSTTISFSLPRSAKVEISIFDITGRLVETLADHRFESGEHSLVFDGTALPSGIYFARLHAGESVKTQKMVLLK